MTAKKVDNRHRLTFGGFVQSIVRRRGCWFAFTLMIYLAVFFISYLLAFLVRFDFSLKADQWQLFCQTLGIVLLVKTVVFHLQWHFRNRWFYASVKDLRMIVESSVISLLVFSFFVAFNDRLHLPSFSRSILVIDFGATIMLLGGVRLYWRYMKENILASIDPENLKKAFFIGANAQGGSIVGIINTRKDIGYYVVGFLSVHPYKVNMQIGYIPILGTVDDLATLALRRKVKDVLVVAGLLSGPKFRELYAVCQKCGITLQVIPQQEIVPSKRIPMREIGINDLLRREPIRLDTQMIRETMRGKRILVTGAGGSIGSEICRQLLAFEPSELIILGRGENRIFFLNRELLAAKPATKIMPVIADVSNAPRMEEVFRFYQPQIVFHAAAHKHVPLMEANVSEAVLNNIYGTQVTAGAAERFGVERFVLISTDKAVNPTSVMGTSKHLAERYVNAMAERSKTKFIVTRFGNVLGSNGSVVPIFKEQIGHGGPITITDFRMTRFFMTIPEASQLVLEAAALGQGGEIFVLDMGEPVKIVDLAQDMIRLAGLPSESIEIKESGLRPGEKLYEELYFDSEERIKTGHPKLFAAQHRSFDVEQVRGQITSLLQLLQAGNDERIREKLHELVPEYHNDNA